MVAAFNLDSGFTQERKQDMEIKTGVCRRA